MKKNPLGRVAPKTANANIHNTKTVTDETHREGPVCFQMLRRSRSRGPVKRRSSCRAAPQTANSKTANSKTANLKTANPDDAQGATPRRAGSCFQLTHLAATVAQAETATPGSQPLPPVTASSV